MVEPIKKLGVKSVNRNTLSRQVVEQIVQLLIDGQLKPGDKLPTEMELIEELEVSRPVLREAFSALEILDIIIRKTREGTFFNNKIGTHPFSMMLALAADNIQAITEARMALELGLITISAEKITDEQLSKLRETIEIIASSTDNNYGEADKEFHRIIALSANNPVVEGMIDSLLVTHSKTDSLIQYRERDLTVKYHQAIYDALEAREPIQAFNRMYEHLNYVRLKVLNGAVKSNLNTETE